MAAIYLILLYGVWAIGIPNGFTYILRATVLTLVVLAVTQGLLSLIDALFRRGLSLRSDLNDRFPGLEKRVNRYFPALQKSINAGLYLVAAFTLLEVWGVHTYAWLTSGPGSVLGSAAAHIIGIIVASLLLWETVSSIIERYLGETDVQVTSARTRTLLNVARNALLVVITIVSSLMVLSELGVNIAPLLAGAGVIGLAVGFGAQRLVQDVITGVFILFQDLMAVGDVVKLGDTAGLVESLSIRTVRLRDLSGTVHTIPFSAITTVSNLTEDFSYYVFDVGIAYREDVDAVIDLLRQIGSELREDKEFGPLLLDNIEIFGVDAFGDSAVVIKGRLKTLPIQQWTVGRAFNRLLKYVSTRPASRSRSRIAPSTSARRKTAPHPPRTCRWRPASRCSARPMKRSTRGDRTSSRCRMRTRAVVRALNTRSIADHRAAVPLVEMRTVKMQQVRTFTYRNRILTAGQESLLS